MVSTVTDRELSEEEGDDEQCQKAMAISQHSGGALGVAQYDIESQVV